MVGETADLAQLLLWGYHRCHFPKKPTGAEGEGRQAASQHLQIRQVTVAFNFTLGLY